MREHKKHPSKERLDELLRYEPETGKLFWKRSGQACGHKINAEAGAITSSGYRSIRIDRVGYSAHNLVWIMKNYFLPMFPNTVDHKNRNPLDNRIQNLREATPRQQRINRRARGFTQDRGMWKAASKSLSTAHIGRFKTALQARLAYEKATSEVEPEFASTFFTDAFNELIASAS